MTSDEVSALRALCERYEAWKKFPYSEPIHEIGRAFLSYVMAALPALLEENKKLLNELLVNEERRTALVEETARLRAEIGAFQEEAGLGLVTGGRNVSHDAPESGVEHEKIKR